MNSYLGQTPVFGDFPFQILSGDGTGFYELSFKTNGTNGLLVFLNGAVQRPGIDFTCDGDALTFSANVSAGVQIFVYGMGLPKSSLAPSAGSIGLAEINNEIRAFDGDAQDWANLLKLLTPKGLDDSLKGSNQLLAASGYQKLPGGLIVQWGSGTYATASLITFPIAFPAVCASVVTSVDAFSVTSQLEVPMVSNITKANFETYHATGVGGTYTGIIRWLAVGY